MKSDIGTRLVGKFSWLCLMVLLVSGLGAQVGDHPHHRLGLPQDWTHSHVIFTRAAMNSYPLMAAEPRVLHQWLRQNVGRMTLATTSETTAGETKRDWSVPLGTARVAAGMFPAKYGFDTTAAPSCTNDYVVFGLNVAGSATQANLIAFNQLYRGTPAGQCGTGNPAVLFSYNVNTIGGRIATSPILSLDGTKIAFVETTGGAAVFHVLTWKTGAGNGTSATAPAVPGAGNTASMVDVPLGNTSVTRSSPWIDYSTDTVYVGNNGGAVNKITGVFKGTPTRAGAPWPFTASGGRILSAPVLDKITGNIFVGDGQALWFRLIRLRQERPRHSPWGESARLVRISWMHPWWTRRTGLFMPSPAMTEPARFWWRQRRRI